MNTQEIVQQETAKANTAIRQILETFNAETGLTISEIKIELINAASKGENMFMIGNIQFKIIS